MRIPKHIGIIPDGNRRWAEKNGLKKHEGYKNGINQGLCAFKECQKLGVEELTFYGFTADNTKRPSIQTVSFTKACIDAVELIKKEDAQIYVAGNSSSKMFPNELKEYTKRRFFGKGGIKVNFLINYSYEWDLNIKEENKRIINTIDISRVDLIIRWGGMRRLSGFLPIQSVYSDFYVIDELWPDYKNEHIYEAVKWYNKQDITLGG